MENKKARARARYLKMMERNQNKNKRRPSDVRVEPDAAQGRKPQHEKRFSNLIECFPQIGKPEPLSYEKTVSLGKVDQEALDALATKSEITAADVAAVIRKGGDKALGLTS